jgi:hypothetical protein
VTTVCQSGREHSSDHQEANGLAFDTLTWTSLPLGQWENVFLWLSHHLLCFLMAAWADCATVFLSFVLFLSHFNF